MLGTKKITFSSSLGPSVEPWNFFSSAANATYNNRPARLAAVWQYAIDKKQQIHSWEEAKQ